MRTALKEKFAGFTKTIVVVLLSVALALVGLQVMFGAAGKRQEQLQNDTLHGVLATACVLSLPVDETGRDPLSVKLCFTQYGLQPPTLQNP